jgi:hypothetical protein
MTNTVVYSTCLGDSYGPLVAICAHLVIPRMVADHLAQLIRAAQKGSAVCNNAHGL